VTGAVGSKPVAVVLWEQLSDARWMTPHTSVHAASMRRSPAFMGGIQHGNDVLSRDIGLNIVNLGEYVPSPRLEYANLLSDMFADFLGRSIRKNVLSIAPAAPKDDLAAELLLQPFGCHVGC